MKTKLQYTALLLVLGLSGCAAGDFSFRPIFGGTDTGAADASVGALGKRAILEGNLGLAIKYYQAALDRNPSSIEALNGLAATYDNLKRFDLAQRYYDRALELDPRATQTLNNVGYSYLLQGRRDVAAAFLKEALAANPDNETVRTNLQLAEAAPAPRDGNPAFAAAAAAEPVTALDRTSSVRNGIARPPLRIERATPLVQMLVKETAVADYAENGDGDGNVRAIAASYVTTATDTNLAAAASPTSRKSIAPVSEAVSRILDTAILISSRQRRPIIEVSNGTGRTKMAARMRDYLEENGIRVRHLTNASSFSHRATTVSYRNGWEVAAEEFAKALPIRALMQSDDEGRAEIRITLGADLLDFDAELRANVERESHHAAR